MISLRTSGFLAALAVAIALTSCASTGDGSGGGNAIFGSVFGADFSARQPSNSPDAGAETAIAGATTSNGIVYLGTASADGDRSHQSMSSYEPGDFSLNFQNADLREVVQSVLGDALKRNYTIDPKVAGTVTISSARPLSEEDLLTVLENVLKMNGAALIKDGAGFKVVEQTSAVAGWADVGEASPGFGVSILPLRYVSARTVISLVDGFAAPAGTVRAEAARNILIVVGSSADRKAAIETALSFDQDWMQDQSVAIVPLRKTKPETIVPELERIFRAGQGDIGADIAQFIPMSRLKAVLVVAAQREALERATTWVQRLDSNDANLEAKVFVYRVKYRDAQKLAGLVSQLFSSGTGSEADSPAAQIEPGAVPVVSEAVTGDPEVIAEPALGSGSSVMPIASAAAGRTRIQADPSNNSIVIFADVETRQEILAALSRIDVPQLQVAINVTMAEIRLTDDLRYGVQFFLEHNKGGSAGLFGAGISAIGRELPGFNFLLGAKSSPDVVISAFNEITDVQILSSPSLVVVENETARFQVGDQIPIVTRTVTPVQDSTAPVSNEVTYRDTGIILQVKPRVSENGTVSLEIEQEISSVAGGSATLTPTITNRKVSSSISVVDGQTVLLGGLISEQTNLGRSGIPGLSKMRGIGNLFGRRGQGNNRTELIILIRPSVIRDGQDAQHVAEELRSRMRNLESSVSR